MGKPRSSHLWDTLGTRWGNQGQIQTLCCVAICELYDLRESTWLKAGPGQVKNIIYCTRQLRRIRFHCLAKETMDFWAFLWPIYSDYGIYLCLFPLTNVCTQINFEQLKLPRKMIRNKVVLDTNKNQFRCEMTDTGSISWVPVGKVYRKKRVEDRECHISIGINLKSKIYGQRWDDHLLRHSFDISSKHKSYHIQ